MKLPNKYSLLLASGLAAGAALPAYAQQSAKEPSALKSEVTVTCPAGSLPLMNSGEFTYGSKTDIWCKDGQDGHVLFQAVAYDATVKSKTGAPSILIVDISCPEHWTPIVQPLDRNPRFSCDPIDGNVSGMSGEATDPNSKGKIPYLVVRDLSNNGLPTRFARLILEPGS